jgi:PAS domain S-box-containing protein
MTLLDLTRSLRPHFYGRTRRDKPLPQRAADSKILMSDPGLLKKLAVPVVVIAIQALVATASLQTLSILRVFIECESQWSKSQKDSFNYLAQYLDLGDEQDYQRFQTAVADVIEHNAARQALEKAEPEIAAATARFLHVGVHPNDIPGLIFIFLHFRQYSYFRQAITLWQQTDPMLAELVSLGKTIHAQNEQGGRPGSDAALRTYLREFDGRFSTMATAFSKALGAGTRAVTTMLAFANIGAALALMSLVVWRMRNLFRRSQLFENALSSEKEQAQVTLQAIGDAVIRVTASGSIDYANAAAERLIGMNQTRAQGRLLSSLVAIIDMTSLDTRCHIESLLNCDDAKRGPVSELTLVTAASSTPVSIQTAPFEVAGKTVGTVLVLRDMTRERELIGKLSWQATMTN